MKRRLLSKPWLLAYVATALILLSFQNCSQNQFTSMNESSSTELSNSPIAELCPGGGCLKISGQEIYLTNIIGGAYAIELISAEKKDNIQIKVKAANNGRYMNLRLTVNSKGYVEFGPKCADCGQHEYMAFDQHQACDALIGGNLNCSARPILVGTKQKYLDYNNSPYTSFDQYHYANIRAGQNGSLKGFSIGDQLLASGQCPADSCFLLPMANVRVVVSDLHLKNNGLFITEAFQIGDAPTDDPDSDRYKITVSDSEGRKLSFIVHDSQYSNWVANTAHRMFNENDHGYLCLDQKLDGLAQVKVTKEGQQREMVNCFAGVRYEYLNNSNSITSGILSFTGYLGLRNTSLWAINEDFFFTELRTH